MVSLLKTEGPAYESWCEVYAEHGQELAISDWARAVQWVAIVTSDSAEWINWNLERFGRTEGWDCICCADGDRSIAKPLPHLYETALDHLGIDAGEAIAFLESLEEMTLEQLLAARTRTQD